MGSRSWGPEGGGPKSGGPEGVGARTQKKWGPEGWGARRVGPRRVGGAQNFALFFSLSHRKIRSFLLSLWVFSWNLGGV